ncbi:MAG: phage protease [Patescibacteria group bacterium]
MSPFANFPDFQSCVDAQKNKGHSEDSSKKICGAIQNRIEGKNTEQLSESELKVVNEYVQKFQGDNRPPLAWWNRCVSANEGKVDDVGAYCGFLYHHVVVEKGADIKFDEQEQSGYREAFNKTKEFVKQFSETVTLEEEEIFETGTWNGDKYTKSDLEQMVENFEALKSEVKPPVKLGHNEKQKLLEEDGLPAAGWITKLKVKGDKLVATLSDVPRKIYELIKNRAYKRKSAEIYPSFKASDGKIYRPVLRAVAILGQDIPAVTTIGDIHALYKDKGNQKFKIYDFKEGGEKMKTLGISVSSETFSEDFQKKFNEAMKAAFGEEVAIKFEGDTTDADTIAGLKSKIAELEKELADYKDADDEHDSEMMKEKVATATKELEATKTKLTESEKKVSELTETKTKLAEAEKKLEEQVVTAHEADVEAFIEKAKADGKILPKHEQLLSVLMKQIDRKSVVKFTEKIKVADGKEEDKEVTKTSLEIVKAFVESLPKAVEFAEISKSTGDIETFVADGGKVKIGEQVFEVDDVKLAAETRVYAEKNKVSYEIALPIVAKMHEAK